MKRYIAFLLSAIMIASALALTPAAAGNPKHAGIQLEYTTTAGASHPTGYYVTEKRYEKIPVTFEAWVYIPSQVYSKRGGIIIGNYQSFSKDDFVNFEIHQNGVPRLLFCDPSGTMHDYKFTAAAVPANTWTHVSIVYGTGDRGKQIFCYINGEFKQSTKISEWYEAPIEVLDNPICLAGDRRVLNEQGFRGTLGDVAVYSDVRTPDEIKADYNGSPDTSDSELILWYDLSNAASEKDVPDASKNGYDMKYYRIWLSEAEMEEIRAKDKYKYSYTLAFLPDVQYMTQNNPDKLHPMFSYLIDNAQKQNIQYVIGLGDMTNTNVMPQWQAISKEIGRLNGIIPYSIICGNHDIAFDSPVSMFDMVFGKSNSYYGKHVAANGGSFNEGSVKNTYLLFSVGKVDYIIINLDFGATGDILEWMDGILTEHADRRAIIATHGYLNSDGTTLNKGDYATPSSYRDYLTDGDTMWDTFISKHENVDMVVCGHMHSDNIVCAPATGDNGNTVYQLLMDPQSTDKKLSGLGIVALMRFTEDGDHARVDYYSTVLGKFFMESNSDITLDFSEPSEETTTEETTSAPVPESSADTAPVKNEPEGGCGSVALSLPAVILAAGLMIRKKKR